MKLIFLAIISALFVIPCLSQEKEIIKCKIKTKDLKSVKYYTGSVQRIEDTLSIHIAVKANQINESDLVLIAEHLKERFCKEMRLVVMIFDDKYWADGFNPTFKSAINSLRGEYILDKLKGEDYLSFVKIPDYFNHPKDRIRINL